MDCKNFNLGGALEPPLILSFIRQFAVNLMAMTKPTGQIVELKYQLARNLGTPCITITILRKYKT